MEFAELSTLVEQNKHLLMEKGFEPSEENRVSITLPALKSKILELSGEQQVRNYDTLHWADLLLDLVDDCFNISRMLQNATTQRRAVDIAAIDATENTNHDDISLYDSFLRDHERRLSGVFIEFKNRHPDSELSDFVSCLNEDGQSTPEVRYNRYTGQLSIFGGNNRITMAKILDKLVGLHNRNLEVNVLEYSTDPDLVDRANEFFDDMIKQKAKVKAIKNNHSILLSTPEGTYEIKLTELGVYEFFGLEKPQEHQKLPKWTAFARTVQSFF